MCVPQIAVDLIKGFESYAAELPDGRAKAYPDPKLGWQLPTIGYGSTKCADGTPVKQGDIITESQACDYLMAELDTRCRPYLEQISTWNQMNVNQQSALYSFAYNLGAHFYHEHNFESITAVCDSPDRWNDNAWIEAQFVKYRNPGSIVEAGLRARREKEANLFCTAP